MSVNKSRAKEYLKLVGGNFDDAEDDSPWEQLELDLSATLKQDSFEEKRKEVENGKI